MARTDTGDLADVLLPAAGWGEKDGTVTNSERRISRQRSFLPAPGETRPDWKIMCDVASRMGWKDAFDFDTPAAIFGEYVSLSAATRDFGRDLDLSIFADVDYAELIPTQWPQDNKRFFADGQFFHVDGKAKMLPVQAPAVSDAPGLRLNSGRNRDQWHTMSRTGKAPRLGSHLAEPYITMCPSDATTYGIESGDLVSVEGQNRTAILRALVSDQVQPGQPFAPLHWTRQRSSAGTINAVVNAPVDPFSGQPALKSAAITMEKYEADWYAFAASMFDLTTDAAYAAVARSLTGWQGEYAGMNAPDDWEQTARALLNTTDEAATMHDANTGQTRLAFHDGTRLTGLFFVGTAPVTLSRNHAISLIGTDIAPLAALAGRARLDQPDPGQTICACMNVGINTIRSAIADGATTVDALGDKTCAGTSCGSCKPELTALISQFQIPMAAE